MRRLVLVAYAATALSACGGKNEVVENGSAVENLSFESTPANDASALEAVGAENARLAVPESPDEVEAIEPPTSNAGANATANSQ